ncbi:MAG: malto-oligosyltrehalose trehalohydrolase [bacterium]
MRVGAHYLGNGKAEFTVWAPLLSQVQLKLVSPVERMIAMEQDKRGYWRAVADEVFPGSHYYFRLDGERDRPDPASFFQPEGVHGPSQVVDHTAYSWGEQEKSWKGVNLREMVMYEVHVGTFTPEGTFKSIIPRLDELAAFGLKAIELMPVAQFPGERNWGYDGVYLYAVQNSYGGSEGLKHLVAECHRRGMAVILDVVYNHFGPEGNYIWDFGPYLTDKYVTPWGKAINYDDAYSHEVRNFYIENALHWFHNYHIDALRLDAIHAIYDMSAVPFLQELAERVDEFSAHCSRTFHLIAESDLNDARVIRPRDLGGYGLAAQWCDDFHHCLHTLLTGEDQGYYHDFGRIDQLVKSLREGYVYTDQYSPYRKRYFGNSSKDRPAHQFVVFAQNHDQVGNRMLGERLSALVSFEALKLSAGVVFLSPYIPLLFMGEEYGEERPFYYFVSHSDPDLVEAVRRGRKDEFKEFKWKGETPDAQNLETFMASKIQWEQRREGNHHTLLNLYQRLINMRKEMAALSALDRNKLYVSGFDGQRVIFMRRWQDEADSHLVSLFNFKKEEVRVAVSLPEGNWKKAIDSSDKIWNGPGSLSPGEIYSSGEITLNGYSFVVYRRGEGS